MAVKASYKEITAKAKNSSLPCYINNQLAAYLVYLMQGLPISANKITVFSLIFFLATALLLLATGDKVLFAVMLIIAYTLDNMDGIWARQFQQTSNFGAWLDSTLDRIKDVSILFVFLFMFNGLLNVVVAASIFLFFVCMAIEAQSKIYLDSSIVPKKIDLDKNKYRIIAFGPAEYYILILAIVFLPDRFKIIPLFIIFAFFLLSVIMALSAAVKYMNNPKRINSLP